VGGLSVLLAALNLRLKNSRATIVFQAVVIQVFALLGGSFFPVSGIPVMRKLGSLTINGAAMSGFLKLMMGYGPAEVAGTLAVLSGITLVLLAAGVFAAAGTKEV
jgi:ABC-2 type transport system permease protein